jgi:hypothetical protein
MVTRVTAAQLGEAENGLGFGEVQSWNLAKHFLVCESKAGALVGGER